MGEGVEQRRVDRPRVALASFQVTLSGKPKRASYDSCRAIVLPVTLYMVAMLPRLSAVEAAASPAAASTTSRSVAAINRRISSAPLTEAATVARTSASLVKSTLLNAIRRTAIWAESERSPK